MSVHGIDDRLARERRARLQAERLLAQRSEDLYKANKKLSEHAHALSHQVIEQREENAVLVGRSSKAQAALQVATEKADVAERRLWDSLTAFDDGFAIFDADLRLVTANPAWIGAFDGVSDVAPGARFDAILRIAIEEGLVDLEGEDEDAWTRRMSARWNARHIAQVDLKLWNGAYVRLLDKRTPEGDIVSIAVNITDTIRRQRDLAKARDAAEAAARAKSAFLANMSHEIRTPMNGVVSMAEMLRETELDEEQRLFADTIRNSGEALLVIINDVLDYSKIDAGKLVLHSESFSLEAMIHEILRLLRPGVQGKKIDLRVDYDIFLPERMVGDPGRIRQILTNLIGNAVKFTEEGHVTVHVFGEPTEEGSERLPVRVVVEDTGIGIPEDKQAHVFGEFNQVEDEANRGHDGTGLGLAITQRLIRMMEGEMWLTSEVGKGSAFGFSIMLDRDPEAEKVPVPPLPEGERHVHLVAGAAGVPDAFLAKLCRLRADVSQSETVPPDDELSDCAALILSGPTHTEAASGFAGPVLVYNTESADPGGIGVGIGPRTTLQLLRKLLVTPRSTAAPDDASTVDASAEDADAAVPAAALGSDAISSDSPTGDETVSAPAQDQLTAAADPVPTADAPSPNAPAFGPFAPEAEAAGAPQTADDAGSAPAPALDMPGDAPGSQGPDRVAASPDPGDTASDVSPQPAHDDTTPVARVAEDVLASPDSPGVLPGSVAPEPPAHAAAPAIAASPAAPSIPRPSEASAEQKADLSPSNDGGADDPGASEATDGRVDTQTDPSPAEPVGPHVPVASAPAKVSPEGHASQAPATPPSTNDPGAADADPQSATEVSTPAPDGPTAAPDPAAPEPAAPDAASNVTASGTPDAPLVPETSLEAGTAEPAETLAPPQASQASSDEAVPEMAPAMPLPATPPATNAPTRKLRLLAAEDNKTNQLVFKTMLKKLDIDLKLVENGRQLVDAWSEMQPDVIFTDISMPEMDGIAAAKEIRAQETSSGCARVPMVAMTAHAMAEDEARIRAAGIDAYLTKPLTKDRLFEEVRTHCPTGVDPFPSS